MPPQVTVWNEHVHERRDEAVLEVYPDGIHSAIARPLEEAGYEVRTATLDDPEHGLTEAVLEETGVLTWWSHTADDEVGDDVVERVRRRVLEGMGLLVLHSGKDSKVFRRLMGTTCDVKWREADETEKLWVVEPGHPIVDGLQEPIVLPKTETYGEPFGVPAPETLVLLSWFDGGHVFRSGCCYRRGRGRIFYFRPGHETYPIYHDEAVQRVIRNAVGWASPTAGASVEVGHTPSDELID